MENQNTGFEEKMNFFKKTNYFLFCEGKDEFLMKKIKGKSEKKKENYLTLNISFYEIKNKKKKLEKSKDICDFIDDEVKIDLNKIIENNYKYVYQKKDKKQPKYHISLLSFLIDKKQKNFRKFSKKIQSGHIIPNIVSLIEKEIKDNNLKRFEVCLKYLYADEESISLQCFIPNCLKHFLEKLSELFEKKHRINWNDYMVDNKIKLHPEQKYYWGTLNLFKKFKNVDDEEKAKEISKKIIQKNNKFSEKIFEIDKLYLVLSDPYFKKSKIVRTFNL